MTIIAVSLFLSVGRSGLLWLPVLVLRVVIRLLPQVVLPAWRLVSGSLLIRGRCRVLLIRVIFIRLVRLG